MPLVTPYNKAPASSSARVFGASQSASSCATIAAVPTSVESAVLDCSIRRSRSRTRATSVKSCSATRSPERSQVRSPGSAIPASRCRDRAVGQSPTSSRATHIGLAGRATPPPLSAEPTAPGPPPRAASPSVPPARRAPPRRAAAASSAGTCRAASVAAAAEQ